MNLIRIITWLLVIWTLWFLAKNYLKKQKQQQDKKNTRNLYEVPEAQLRKDKIEFLPTTLKDALDHFESDEVLHDALGEEFSAMYVEAKRREWDAYHRSVSQWELDNYIATY